MITISAEGITRDRRELTAHDSGNRRVLGTSIGPYLVLERLGAGGMGEVYLAQHTTLERKVALKRLTEGLLAAPGARERLQREARAAATLSHPNIAAIYDILDTADGPVIVMEY